MVEVDGPEKLQQDMRCLLIERLDSDPFIKGFGSDLASLIPDMGGYDPDSVKARVQVETVDAIRRYHNFQISNLNQIRRRPWATNADFLTELALMRSQLISSVDSITVNFSKNDFREILVEVVLITEAREKVILPGIAVTL